MRTLWPLGLSIFVTLACSPPTPAPTPTRHDCSCALTCAGAPAQVARISVCVGTTAEAVTESQASCAVHAPCSGATCSCNCVDLPTADASACSSTDLCATANGGCSANSTCTPFTGGVSCACSSGYSSTAGICTDVDECAAGTAHCSANAACTNTPGSFSCACNAGYSGNGVTCTDVDECAAGTATCGANALCTNTPGAFTCACRPGFAGDGVTCTDIDECDGGVAGCSAHAACANAVGSFACTCLGGFLGDGGVCGSIIPPSGVAGCYGGACPGVAGSASCAATPFCGQDFQYPQRARTLTSRTAGADTVIDDSRTGLTWMKSYLGPSSAQAGVTTCAGLTFAGVTGWRLPPLFQLYGLYDLGRSPLIDPQFDLPAPATPWFFSSTIIPLVGCGAGNTDYGAAAFNTFNTGSACSPFLSYSIRCVRGPDWTPDAAGRFTTVTRAGAPVVVDSLTGLEWQGGASYQGTASTTWASLLAYCEGSTYGGSDDWRLPDFMEAQTVVFKPLALGDATASLVYVTSTYVGSGVLGVRASDGLTYPNVSPTAVLAGSSPPRVARCVRGGGR